MHCDLWGSSPDLSLSGYDCYIFFLLMIVLNMFGCTHCLPNLKPITFFEFKTYVENILSSRIKAFQSDGGVEFMSTRFQTFLASHGTVYRISCPHKPKQDGAAKRKHQQIVKIGLTLLPKAHMPSVIG